MEKRVVVTGMGVLSPNAVGIDQFKDALKSGKSGIGPISSFEPVNLKTKIAAEVSNFDPLNFMSAAVARKCDRFSHLGLAAAQLAIEDARLLSEKNFLENASVIFGSGLGGSLFHEEMIQKFVRENGEKKLTAAAVSKITPNAVSAQIALYFNIKGSNLVISTACSSSANAVGEAYRRIKGGREKCVIAGGVEAPVSPVNMAMYEAMMVLGAPVGEDLTSASRPFDKTRNGFVMAEGAGCIVLEDYESAVRRGVEIYGEIIGFGSTCGAYNMVAPNPTGEDAEATMKLALEEAKLSPSDVDNIYAHGTSTKFNDIAETRAIRNLFKSHAYKVPVSAIKSMVGHAIGAAGVLQVVAALLSIRSNFLSPTINLNEPDSECDLDYVANKSRVAEPEIILSNSFGFGSNNAALLLRGIK